jgi:hypothetical protein
LWVGTLTKTESYRSFRRDPVGLSQNHPFADGNKGAATAAMAAHPTINGS